MKFLMDERQTGKTEALVEWVRKGAMPHLGSTVYSRVILVADSGKYRQLISKYGLDPRQVHTYAAWSSVRSSDDLIQVAFDDVERILGQVAGWSNIPAVAALSTKPMSVTEFREDLDAS